MKKIIHAIKYFHRKDLVLPLTKAVAQELTKNNQIPNLSDSILIPIPMPLLRKYIRGYNQAELIAQELSKRCLIPYTTKLLHRKGNHKRQVTKKTRSERIKNQHHSFIVKGDVNNLNIILVDDVTTTGATIIEARNELLKAGAKSVRAITIAH
jgi:ComF family protein